MKTGRLLAVKSMKIREVSDPDVLADTLVTLTEELAAQGGIAVQDIASVGRASLAWWISAPAPSCIPATCLCGTFLCGS